MPTARSDALNADSSPPRKVPIVSCNSRHRKIGTNLRFKPETSYPGEQRLEQPSLDEVIETARQASLVSPPRFLTAGNTFCPSWRTPSACGAQNGRPRALSLTIAGLDFLLRERLVAHRWRAMGKAAEQAVRAGLVIQRLRDVVAPVAYSGIRPLSYMIVMFTYRLLERLMDIGKLPTLAELTHSGIKTTEKVSSLSRRLAYSASVI